MSHERLMELGGEPVGSEIFVKRVAMGKFVDGGFSLYPAGESFLAEQDAPAPKVEKVAKVEKAPRGVKAPTKVEPTEPAGDEKPADPLAGLEGL